MLPATTLRLAKDFKNIVAIKEASGSLPQCMQLVQDALEGFNILSGDDNLALPQMAIGMKGIISVAANSYPKDFSSMVHAALDNNYNEARRLHYKLLEKMELLFVEGNPTGVKAVLADKGIIQNELRLPLVKASDDLYSKLNNGAVID